MNKYLLELSRLARRFFSAFCEALKEEDSNIWVAAPAVKASTLLIHFRPALQNFLTSRLNLLAEKIEEQLKKDKKIYEDVGELNWCLERGDWHDLLLQALIDVNTLTKNKEKILELGKWCLDFNPLQAVRAFKVIRNEQFLKHVLIKLSHAPSNLPRFRGLVEAYLYFMKQNVYAINPNKILRLASKTFIVKDDLSDFLMLIKSVMRSCKPEDRKLPRKIILTMAEKYMGGEDADMATGLLRIIGEKPQSDQIAIMAENNLKKGYYYSALRLYKKLGRVREGKRKVLEAELENKGHSHWHMTESPHGFEKTFMMSMRKSDIVQTAREMVAKGRHPYKLLKYLYAVGDIDFAKQILFPSDFSGICLEERAANSYCDYLSLLEKKLKAT